MGHRSIHTPRHIVMLGPSTDSLGGIASVIDVYQRHGWFERWSVRFYETTKPSIGRLRKLWIGLCVLCTLFWDMCHGRIILIHAHVACNASFWRKSIYLWIAHSFGIPTIFHLHGAEFMHFYSSRSRAGKWYIRRLLDRVSEIIVLSSQWKNNIRTLTDNPHIDIVFNPIAVVSQSTDIPKYPDSCRKYPHQLLFLGRLGARKGIDDLIAATITLAPQYPALRVICGGDGEVERIRNIVAKQGLGDRYHIPGWISGEDKSRLLVQSGIYVLPSYDEGLPMSILEAMSAGLPVISTTVGGIPDMIDNGKEGWLIQPGDISALAKYIELLLNNPALQTQMGQAGRERVEQQFTPQRIFSRLDTIYQRLSDGLFQ